MSCRAGPWPGPRRPLPPARGGAVVRVRLGVGPGGEHLGPFRATLGRLVHKWQTDERRLLDGSLVSVAEGALRFLSAVAAASGAALFVLEDLPWAEPETVTIVEHLSDNVVAERGLCVATIRHKGRSAALGAGAAVHAGRVSTLLELPPLPESDVAAMVASCLVSANVPEPVMALAGRADGVPLMVEELLVAALASRGLIEDSGPGGTPAIWKRCRRASRRACAAG